MSWVEFDPRYNALGGELMAKKHKKKHAPPPMMKRPAAAPPPSPMPGPNEFDAGQEQAMRAGARQSRMPPAGPPDEDMDGM